MKDPVELKKNRKELVEKMKQDYGYIYCQRLECGKSSAYKFEVHHIVFRSEKPEHPYLHSKKNLIIVCDKCHNLFHNKKSIRNPLLKRRKLNQIFNLNI